MRLLHGKCEEKLPHILPDSVDAIVTDPPYGLGKPPDALEVLTAWVQNESKEIKGGGFMGKEWDSFVPQPAIWKECFRVLKPGGHMLVACGTRTVDWMAMSIRLGGFEIRDMVAWVYGVGLPKSHNIGKGVDKLQGNEREVIEGGRIARTLGNKLNMDGGAANPDYKHTRGTSEWEGWGTALKPAMELWILARKPISEKNIAENVLKWGTGAMNIDACRISHTEEMKFTVRNPKGAGWNNDACGFDNTKNPVASANEKGRFPANLVWSHHPDCKMVGHKAIKSNAHYPVVDVNGYGKNYGGKAEYIAEGERPGSEEVEDWECVDGCPAFEFAKTGESKSSGGRIGNKGSMLNTSGTKYQKGDPGYGDKGTPARFFYCAKASRSERNRGCEELLWYKPTHKDKWQRIEQAQWSLMNNENEQAKANKQPTPHTIGFGNIHETVKPVSLMQYLCRLITPPGGTVLDPFMGTGTTGMGCKIGGFDFIGIEMGELYFQIAEARIGVAEYGMNIAKACKKEKKKVEKEKVSTKPTSITLADFEERAGK